MGGLSLRAFVGISPKICMFSEMLRVVRWMLDGRPKLAYFMGWLLPLNLVLSTEFGRLAQRQSIGLTHRGPQVQILYRPPLNTEIINHLTILWFLAFLVLGFFLPVSLPISDHLGRPTFGRRSPILPVSYLFRVLIHYLS